MVFLPYASGSMSVRRIIEKLIAGQYAFHFPDIDRWHGRGVQPYYPVQAHDNVYIFTEAGHMESSILASNLSPAQLKYLVCLRDPRDMLVSLYFLSRSQEHLALHADFAIYDQLRTYMEEAQETTVDEYVLGRMGWARGALQALQEFLADIPAGQVRHLSYAALCHAFPFYLTGLIDYLDVSPGREVIAELLATEDIQRADTLNLASLARFEKASPRPGRHKRDLLPETVRSLNRDLEEVLAWMADNDMPEYRPMYDTRTPPDLPQPT
ncbi:MAG: sulfotransferase domain-containing protein [Actinomycetota bacterium]